eukprot:gene9099-10781_t
MKLLGLDPEELNLLTQEQRRLIDSLQASHSDDVSWEALAARSRDLPYEFPTQQNRICFLQGREREEAADHARSTVSIASREFLKLVEGFLQLKRSTGSEREQLVYTHMSPADLIARLLKQRPIVFFGANDRFQLRDGQGGVGGFEDVGGLEESGNLRLDDLLSYDEMQLSALLGVAGRTHFINCGGRDNCAEPGEPETFERKGVYVGLVGARFERQGLMEWQTMIVSRSQNTAERGYGQHADPGSSVTQTLRLWAQFYGLEVLPTFEDTYGQSGFVQLSTDHLLNTAVYKQRMRAVIEPFLAEADYRAKEAGTRAYCHVVGLGLGVWQVHQTQKQLQVEVYADILRTRPLPFVADIDFSYFGLGRDDDHCAGVRNGGVFTGTVTGVVNEIRIHFSRRDPAAKLTGVDEGKLLVAQYAWDSNARPGNEYWIGMLTAS